MKRIIRITTVFLMTASLIFGSSVSHAAVGHAEDDSPVNISESKINPVYEGIVEEDSIVIRDKKRPKSLKASSERVAGDDSAVSLLKREMKLRNEEFSFEFTSDEMLDRSRFEKWIDKAFEETSDPTEGDYLRFSVIAYNFSATMTLEGGKYVSQVICSFKYSSDKQQEDAVTAKLADVMAELALSSDMTDYAKTKKIYDYICANVTYDHENLNNDDYRLKYSSYAALINKTAVCQGYAVLLYRMLEMSGIDTRIISGMSHNEKHSWNIARIGEKYYFLDATWDAGLSGYQHFLQGSDSFPDHEADTMYKEDAFTSAYNISRDKCSPSEQSGTHVKTWQDFAAESFSGGAGTAEDPFRISTANELARLAKLVNDDNYFFSSAYYILTDDIDLKGRDWMPIGNGNKNFDIASDNNMFRGTFDGGGHCVKNMRITKDLGIWWYGLFGFTCGAIKNLTVENAYIKVDSMEAGWQSDNGMGSMLCVGAIAAYVIGVGTDSGHGAIVSDCFVEANIDMKSKMSLFTGTAVGTLNYGTVRNIAAAGHVNAYSERRIDAGGFIGSVSNETVVENCSFAGTVSSSNNGFISDDKESEGIYYANTAGGFVGSAGNANNSVTLKNCAAKGSVYAKSGKYTAAGGFMGDKGIIYGTVDFENLYCDAEASAKDLNGAKSWKFCDNDSIRKWADLADELTFKNLFFKDGDKIKMFVEDNMDGMFLVVSSEDYDISVTDFEKFSKEKLGLDESVWSIKQNEPPVLKISGQWKGKEHEGCALDADGQLTCGICESRKADIETDIDPEPGPSASALPTASALPQASEPAPATDAPVDSAAPTGSAAPTVTDSPGTTAPTGSAVPAVTNSPNPVAADSLASAVPAPTGSTAPASTDKVVPAVSKVKNLKVSFSGKKLLVKWSRLSGISGYKLQISEKSNYKKKREFTLKASKTSYKISKIKKKKKYFVRIRGYKKYKNAKGTTKTKYGAWVSIKIKT